MISEQPLLRIINGCLLILATLFCHDRVTARQVEELNFRTAMTRKQLSEAELVHLLKNNTALQLKQLESLSDQQAELLGTAISVRIDNIRKLSDRQLELLGRARFLGLDGLRELTDKQAQSLGNCKEVSLASLKSITPTQCQSLQNVEILNLDGLESVSDEVAEALGKGTAPFAKWLAVNHARTDRDVHGNGFA